MLVDQQRELAPRLPPQVAAYLADPLCYSGRTRIRTAFQYGKVRGA